jgi:hypothetical protein
MEQYRLLGVGRMGVWSVSWCLCGFNKPSHSRNNCRISTGFGLILGEAFVAHFPLKIDHTFSLGNDYVPLYTSILYSNQRFVQRFW